MYFQVHEPSTWTPNMDGTSDKKEEEEESLDGPFFS